jgi:hypothetical protein
MLETLYAQGHGKSFSVQNTFKVKSLLPRCEHFLRLVQLHTQVAAGACYSYKPARQTHRHDPGINKLINFESGIRLVVKSSELMMMISCNIESSSLITLKCTFSSGTVIKQEIYEEGHVSNRPCVQHYYKTKVCAYRPNQSVI